MPKYVLNNTALNYAIDFEVDGEKVIPTSATITLTNNAGSVVGSINNSSVTITGPRSVFTISAGNNTTSLDYDLRFIDVDFVYNSKSYHIHDYYTIKSNFRIPVTAEDVRLFVGLTAAEISDDQIDIFGATSQVQDDMTSNITTLISSGSALIPTLQVAIKAKAAFNCLTFIETTIMQSEQADNTLYRRYDRINFQDMFTRLQGAYDTAINKLNGVTVGDADAVTIFLAVTGTDPVTGA